MSTAVHVVAELDRRLAEARQLLGLEEAFLAQVRAAGLDATDVEWLIARRRRYIDLLIARRGDIVARRQARHPAPAEVDAAKIPDPPPMPAEE